MVYRRALSPGTNPDSLADLATALATTLKETNMSLATTRDRITALERKYDPENFTPPTLRPASPKVPNDEFTQRVNPFLNEAIKSVNWNLYPDYSHYPEPSVSLERYQANCGPENPNAELSPAQRERKAEETLPKGMPRTNRQWQEYYEACFWLATHGGTTYGTTYGSSGFGNVVRVAKEKGWNGVAALYPTKDSK